MTTTLTQVTNLLGKKKVYVYYINKLSQLRVYLDRTQVSINLIDLSISFMYINLIYVHQFHFISTSFISHLSTQHLEHLQLLLTEQTDVEPGSQILLLNVTFNVQCLTLTRNICQIFLMLNFLSSIFNSNICQFFAMLNFLSSMFNSDHLSDFSNA